VALRHKDFYRSNTFADKAKILDKNEAQPVLSTTFAANLDRSQVKKYLHCSSIVGTKAEAATIDYLLKSKDTEAMRAFLVEFWERRNKRDPIVAFGPFRKRVDEAESRYGKRQKAIPEVDRCRIYIKHGPPNSIDNEMSDRDAPNRSMGSSGAPYEVWRYYYIEATDQSTVQFVFIQDAVAGNEYILSHSNCRGEIFNPNWRQKTRGFGSR
jgi:GWxTD domain-containing protein